MSAIISGTTGKQQFWHFAKTTGKGCTSYTPDGEPAGTAVLAPAGKLVWDPVGKLVWEPGIRKYHDWPNCKIRFLNLVVA